MTKFSFVTDSQVYKSPKLDTLQITPCTCICDMYNVMYVHADILDLVITLKILSIPPPLHYMPPYLKKVTHRRHQLDIHY